MLPWICQIRNKLICVKTGACSGAATGRGPCRREGPSKQKCSPGALQWLRGWKVRSLGLHRLSPSPWKLGPNILPHLSSLSPEQPCTGPSSVTLKFLNVTAVFSCPPPPHVSTSNLSTFLARLGLRTCPFSQPLWAKNSASYLAVSLAQLPGTFIINLLTILLDHLLPCHMDLVNVPTQSQSLDGQQMSLADICWALSNCQAWTKLFQDFLISIISKI